MYLVKAAHGGSLFPMLDVKGTTHWTFSVWTSGTLEVQFQMMKGIAPFMDEALRRELLTGLAARKLRAFMPSR